MRTLFAAVLDSAEEGKKNKYLSVCEETHAMLSRDLRLWMAYLQSNPLSLHKTFSNDFHINGIGRRVFFFFF